MDVNCNVRMHIKKWLRDKESFYNVTYLIQILENNLEFIYFQNDIIIFPVSYFSNH